MTRISKRFGRRIQSRVRAEQAFGLPVISEIPAMAPRHAEAGDSVEVASHPDSECSQAYRQLAAHIRRVIQHERGLDEAAADGSTVLITSARDEPARSYVAVNLAALFADAGDRVIVATTRGLDAGQPGTGSASPEQSGNGGDPTTPSTVVARARPSWITGVSSLALGDLFATSEDLLRDFAQFTTAAHEVVNNLVLEAPLLSSRVGATLLSAVDLVVVVCEWGRTTAEDGFESQRLLRQDKLLPAPRLVLANAPT